MIAKITTNSTEAPSGAKTQAGSIPPKLMEELERFKQRNPIGDNQHCPRCIKAHAIKKAKEMNLRGEVLDSIDKMFDCEAGHMGYYKDGDKIIEI